MRANQHFQMLRDTVDETATPVVKAARGYAILGLTSEVGELAGELKKVIRNDGGIVSDGRFENIVNEVGDILWYLELLSREYKFDLEDAIECNREKLIERVNNGTIKER